MKSVSKLCELSTGITDLEGRLVGSHRHHAPEGEGVKGLRGSRCSHYSLHLLLCARHTDQSEGACTE